MTEAAEPTGKEPTANKPTPSKAAPKKGKPRAAALQVASAAKAAGAETGKPKKSRAKAAAAAGAAASKATGATEPKTTAVYNGKIRSAKDATTEIENALRNNRFIEAADILYHVDGEPFMAGIAEKHFTQLLPELVKLEDKSLFERTLSIGINNKFINSGHFVELLPLLAKQGNDAVLQNTLRIAMTNPGFRAGAVKAMMIIQQHAQSAASPAQVEPEKAASNTAAEVVHPDDNKDGTKADAGNNAADKPTGENVPPPPPPPPPPEDQSKAEADPAPKPNSLGGKFGPSQKTDKPADGEDKKATDAKHFSDEDYRILMALHADAGHIEDVHNEHHLRLDYGGGHHVTITKDGIEFTSKALAHDKLQITHERFKAGILSAKHLYGDEIEATGDRSFMIYAHAYAKVYGVKIAGVGPTPDMVGEIQDVVDLIFKEYDPGAKAAYLKRMSNAPEIGAAPRPATPGASGSPVNLTP